MLYISQLFLHSGANVDHLTPWKAVRHSQLKMIHGNYVFLFILHLDTYMGRKGLKGCVLPCCMTMTQWKLGNFVEFTNSKLAQNMNSKSKTFLCGKLVTHLSIYNALQLDLAHCSMMLKIKSPDKPVGLLIYSSVIFDLKSGS